MKKQNMKKAKEELIIISLVSLFLIFLSTLVIATPTGPSLINITDNDTGTVTAAKMINITGGNISKVNITATMQNPHWKAFVGWVNGMFTLDDSSGATIYDWSLVTVAGEVYATRASSTVEWTAINCANSTHITAEDVALDHDGEDNITSTFSSTNTNTFVAAGIQIAAGNCSSTNTYVSDAEQSSVFEEVILYDATNIVFATILEEDEIGFDGSTYDFQMIVPENANETFSGSTAYYLYVELS